MLTIWQSAKRYIVGAMVGLIVSSLAVIGIDAAADPETLAQVEGMVASFVTFLFYVVTVLVKTFLQNRAIDQGKVLPERMESAEVVADNATKLQAQKT